MLFHNKYAETRGWIRISTPTPVKGYGDERTYVQKSLGEGLGLHNDPNAYTIFRDQISGLEFIRNSQELYNAGFYTELRGYEYHVYLGFREVMDDESQHYAKLAEYLQGGGVPDIQEALQEHTLMTLLAPYRELVNPGWYQWVIEKRLQVASLQAENEVPVNEKPEDGIRVSETPEKPVDIEPTVTEPQEDELALFFESLIALEPVLQECEVKALKVYQEILAKTDGDGDPELAARHTRQDLTLALTLPTMQGWFSELAASDELTAALDYLQNGPGGKQPLQAGDPVVWGSLLGFVFNHRLSEAAFADGTAEQSRTWLTEWLLGKLNMRTLVGLGVEEGKAAWQVELVKLLVGCQDWYQSKPDAALTPYKALQGWLKDNASQRFINANRYEGVLWFNKESFEELLWWMYAAAVLQIGVGLLHEPEDPAQVAEAIQQVYAVIVKLQAAEERSDFQVEKLLAAAKKA